MLKTFNIFGTIVMVWTIISIIDASALNGAECWNLFSILLKIF